jgi:hypothetical protein
MKAELVREIATMRQAEFYKTLTMLRAQFNLRIMEAATQGQKSALIEIPASYLGREPYDWVEMGKAIVEQMREDGYIVNGTYLKFCVCWDKPVATKKSPDPSPSSQTLIRVPKPMKKKS